MSRNTFILVMLAVGLLAIGYVKAVHSAKSSVADSRALFLSNSAPTTYERATEVSARQVVCRQTLETFRASYLQAAFDSADVQSQDEAIDKWLAEWVTQNATAAAQFVESIPPGTMRVKALRILAQTWGGQNPEAAIAWASNLSESERDMAYKNVCLGLAGQDPEKACQLAVQAGVGDNDVLPEIIQQWSGKNISGALTWAEQQPAGDTRDQLIKRIAFMQSKADPLQAANLVVEQIQPGDTQNEAAMSVLHQWGQRDLVGSLSWVEKFPAGQFRIRAIEELEGIAKYRLALKDN